MPLIDTSNHLPHPLLGSSSSKSVSYSASLSTAEVESTTEVEHERVFSLPKTVKSDVPTWSEKLYIIKVCVT